MNKLLILFTFSIVTVMTLASCDSESTGNEGVTGTMEVKMTDAPANYDVVLITVNSVHVRRDENTEINEKIDQDEKKEDGWVTILDEPMEINLLELINGNNISLGSEEVETGSYSQIRLILGENNTITVDGETFDLTTPSAQQSGLKLNIDADVEAEARYSLLIDFDAARSIVETGSGKYILKPVLRVINLSETGSISGTVQPSDFNTNVMAVAEGDTISTITNDDGNFKIMGLTEGNYDVTFDASSEIYADSTQSDISVEEGENTKLDTINLKSAVM